MASDLYALLLDEHLDGVVLEDGAGEAAPPGGRPVANGAEVAVETVPAVDLDNIKKFKVF